MRLCGTSQSRMPPKTRPSPTESAAKTALGERKVGNDGCMYEVVENKNHVHRWKKLS